MAYEPLSDQKMAELREEYGIDEKIYSDEIVQAFVDCFSQEDLEHLEESYSGSFRNDAEFAQDMADNVGPRMDDLQWPLTCIDWDQAAKELMYDYCKENGHYFRNF